MRECKCQGRGISSLQSEQVRSSSAIGCLMPTHDSSKLASYMQCSMQGHSPHGSLVHLGICAAQDCIGVVRQVALQALALQQAQHRSIWDQLRCHGILSNGL